MSQTIRDEGVRVVAVAADGEVAQVGDGQRVNAGGDRRDRQRHRRGDKDLDDGGGAVGNRIFHRDGRGGDAEV